jgi:hypothetical protein
VKLDQFCPLVCHVVDNSPDVVIWVVVFSLINIFGPLTPPPSSIAPAFKGTPIKTSLTIQLSIGKVKPSLYTPGEGLEENRIYSCLVVSPAGRVISDFKTTKELLESMRDAIKAHQSLYMTGNILHRHISLNNIIITDPETADGFKGVLIDLKLAKVRTAAQAERGTRLARCSLWQWTCRARSTTPIATILSRSSTCCFGCARANHGVMDLPVKRGHLRRAFFRDGKSAAQRQMKEESCH